MPKKLATLATMAVLAVPTNATAQTLAEANVKLLAPYDTVKVSKIPEGIFLRSTNDPDDIIWERLPEYRVEMNPAFAAHESVELRINYDDETTQLYMTLAKTSERFYVRLRWVDETRDTATSFERFRDGAAVQFSLGNDETSPVMGDGPDSAVNIWYWRSDDNSVQNLAAGGPGSTTMLDEQPVTGDAMYFDNAGDPNEWVVVMSRPLASEGPHTASFDRDIVPMSFAIWQGTEQQRDGLKSVLDGWVLLDMSSE